jgi:hypothetical protein
MARRGVFISYRRDDAPGVAGRLRDSLRGRKGIEVFRDVDAIPGGANFVASIQTAIQRSSVMLVLIGPKWSELAADRRRAHEKDWIFVELHHALSFRLMVIPVIIEDAQMPKEHLVPTELQPFLSRNAMPLSDRHWDVELEKLYALMKTAPLPAARSSVSLAPPPHSTPIAVPSAAARGGRRGTWFVVATLAVLGLWALASRMGSEAPLGATVSRVEAATATQTVSLPLDGVDLPKAQSDADDAYVLYKSGSLVEAREACRSGLTVAGTAPSVAQGGLWFTLGLVEEAYGDQAQKASDMTVAHAQWDRALADYATSARLRPDADGQRKCRIESDHVREKCGAACGR